MLIASIEPPSALKLESQQTSLQTQSRNGSQLKVNTQVSMGHRKLSKVGSKKASISKETHMMARTASMSIECVSQQRSHSIMAIDQQNA